MLGISVYFKTLRPAYVQEAAKCGVQFIFTSLHIPEEDFSDIRQRVADLLALCQQTHMMLVPDVSPTTFEKLGLEPGDFAALHQMGFTALRLDWGFDDPALLATLQKDFTLFLNASVINAALLDQAQAAGVDLTAVHAAHNFYPKVDTGLGDDYFRQLNARLADSPVAVLAFVPGDALKRFPFYQGLPTLESQRGGNPYVSAVALMHDFGMTDIAIRDSEASIATLVAIHRYQAVHVITLPIVPEPAGQFLLEKDLGVRRDLPARLIRLSVARHPVAVGKTGARPLGTITQDNDLAGRYAGEVQIAKTALPFTRDSNIIGYVAPEFLGLLPFIDGTTKLHFVRAGA